MRPAETDAAAEAKRARAARSEDTGRRTLNARGTGMKKIAVLTALLAGMCASAFAASVSTGVQFGYSPLFVSIDDSKEHVEVYTDGTDTYSAYNLGGSLFIGAGDFIPIPLYVQLSTGLSRHSTKNTYTSDNDKTTDSTETRSVSPEFGVLIGYQIPITPAFKITPSVECGLTSILPVTEEIVLSLNSFNAGTQIDCFINGGWFIKGQFMYGFAFSTKQTNTYTKKNGGSKTVTISEYTTALHGPTFSIGAGYKFS
jgi:hypothetical protein